MLLWACNSPIKKDVQPQKQSLYLNYVQKTGDFYCDSLDNFLKKWRKKSKADENGNFNPPASELYLAALLANLYTITQDEKYITATKTIITKYQEYKTLLKPKGELRPEFKNGIPAVSNFFMVAKYAAALDVLLKNHALNPAEEKIAKDNIAESADFLLITQEWGAMNRAMLRAEGLLYAAKLLPEYANSQAWEQMGQDILSDNVENWSIEDAGMYNMIWLYSVCGYANAFQNEKITKGPFLHYYFEYFKQLYSPANVIPDFGDSWWKSWWAASIPVFEAGSKAFNDAELKWIAEKTFMSETKKGTKNIDLALKLSEAILWGNAEIEPKKPSTKSSQVLDDEIGKKIVFRNGWDSTSNYLLYNYKDQGKSGWLFKDNLINTLSVNHEKMHHGHSDENSIAFWMNNGTVLLHDGGYRDKIPSGDNGQYRADIFHNKLVVRNEMFDTKKTLIGFLKNEGFYEEVTTEKIDFFEAEKCSYSRTKLYNKALNISTERIINYVKDKECFVVFDIVKRTEKTQSKEKKITLANLWHGQHLLDSGKNYMVLRYDSIESWKNPGTDKLLLYFPENQEKNLVTDRIERHRQQERTVAQVFTGSLDNDEYVIFVTVLIPFSHENAAEIIAEISIPDLGNNTIGLCFNAPNQKITIAHKIDLEKDITREWPRPKYTYEAGKIQANEIESNGHFMFRVEENKQLYFLALGLTKFAFNQQILFEQQPVTNEYRLDNAAPTADAWKVRAIEKTVNLPD